MYYEYCDASMIVEEAGVSGVKRWALDLDLADTLWMRGEQWIGVTFCP